MLENRIYGSNIIIDEGSIIVILFQVLLSVVDNGKIDGYKNL